MTARFDNRVLSALCFEMIFCFVKFDARPLFQVPQNFLRQIDVPIQASADRSSAQRKLAQNFDRFLRAFFRIGNLLRVAGKFLAKPDRRRIHQMGPADLDDVPEFFRLRFKRALQFFQRRDETVLQLFGRADVDRGRNHVVARLAHVHVIVRMNMLVRPDRFACKLRAPVRDYFVRVRVCARSGAGLKNVERKMVVEFSLGNFLRCLHNESGALCVEQAQVMIGLRGRPFDQAQRANERPREPIAAHRKIQHRAVGGRAMERIRWQGHLAHRIFFCPRRLLGHAERSAPTPASLEKLLDCAVRRSPLCGDGVL